MYKECYALPIPWMYELEVKEIPMFWLSVLNRNFRYQIHKTEIPKLKEDNIIALFLMEKNKHCVFDPKHTH